jgi:hypothetical protein
MEHNYAKVGGILSIVAGGLGCFSALMIILAAVLLGVFYNGNMYDFHYYDIAPDNLFIVMMVVYIIVGIIGVIISVLAIVGGVYGIKKKAWGLALAGSIAGVLTFFPCGIVAVIFTSLGKPEFETPPLPRAV